jgi:2-phospho-L-lactate/phosphoenolpyruvate guanylyltransferase
VRAAAIIPVKRFGAAKQRLAAELEPSARVRLAGAMLEDVLAAVDATPAVERMIVVTGEPAATRAARAHGAEVIDDPADRGHSRAARLGVERALALDFEVAALVPGDCPLLDSAELDAAMARLSPPQVAIAPAFGEGSRARHEGLARAAGVAARVAPLASLAPDVDTADDLAAVAALLRERPAGALWTAAAIRALGVEDRA